MRTLIAITASLAILLAGCEDPAQNPWSRKVPITKPGPSAGSAPAEMVTDIEAAEGSDVSEADLLGPATEPATQPRELPRRQPISTRPEVVAASALQINDHFITVEDVLLGAREKFVDLPKGISERAFRGQARTIVQEDIRDQLNEYLVYEEAQNRLTDEEKESIKKEIVQTERDMIAAEGGSKAKLDEKLEAQGTSLTKVLEKHQRRLTAQYFLHEKFNPSIVVNRRMLWDYYQSHKAEFVTPKKVQMQIISVTFRSQIPSRIAEPSEATIAKAKVQAKDQIALAAAALKGGEDFAQVAKKFSTDSRKDDGGLWPPMPAGSYRVKKVEDAAFTLPEGKASDIIEEGGNYYIVRPARIQPGETEEFVQAQVRIEDMLRREQFRKLSEEHYEKLVKAAIVVQSEDFMERCVDRSVDRYWGKR